MSFVHQDLGLLPVADGRGELLRLDDLHEPAMEHPLGQGTASGPRRPSRGSACTSNPRAEVADLPAVQRALLAIVRALDDLATYTKGDDARGGLLVLDEPTVFLPRTDRDRLFEVVRRSVAHGASVLFVSHDLDEALSVTDRIDRPSRRARGRARSSARRPRRTQLVELIIGRRLEAFEASHQAHSARGGEHVTVDGPERRDRSRTCPSTMDEGEVLGLTGLVGSGFEEIPYLLFGAEPAKSGRLTDRRHDARARRDVAVGGDRGRHGARPRRPAGRRRGGFSARRDNVMLQVIDDYRPYRLDRGAISRTARGALQEYDVRPPEPMMDFQALSGGNQQKVVLAKWLQPGPRVLLVHEPTQGVDIGARLQVFQTITQAAADGMSVVCASSDYEQLAAICDRVLVFHDGQIVCDLVGDDITKDRIAEQCYLSARTLSPTRT